MHIAIFPRLTATAALLLFCCSVSLAEETTQARSGQDKVRVAAVQVCGYDKTDPPRADYDPTDVLLPYIERAAKDGADLVVFPEYILGFIDIPGPETKKLAATAKEHNLYVIVGGWEKRGEEFANAALIFDRQGRIAGRYYKTHAAVDKWEGDPPWSKPPQGKNRDWLLANDPEWIMQRGEALPVFDFDFGKVGILTCYDGRFPESFRVLSLKGAEIIVWINGRTSSVEDFLVKSVMFHSHVAMVCTNQAYGSGTMIGNPPVEITAQCPDRQEAYIVADIDLANVRKLRHYSRNFQQRRPDLYGELVKPLGE